MLYRIPMFLAVAMAIMLVSGTASALHAPTDPDPSHNDPIQGEKYFKGRCAACHSMKPGVHKAGPSLYGVLGRQAGSVRGFYYSRDLKAAGAKGLEWNDKWMVAFLKDPKHFLQHYLGKRRARSKMKIKYRDHHISHNVIAYFHREATISKAKK